MPSYNELITPIDCASKLLFREYPDLLFKLAFPDEQVTVVNIEENVGINLPTRPVDMVMTVAYGEDDNRQERGLTVF